MPRILGVDVPNNKKTYIALTYLYGVGQHSAIQICETLDIEPEAKAFELTEDQIAQLNTHLDKDHTVEGQLRRQTIEDINRLKAIACYRGVRHRRGMPVRGQNTQTNARTRKGIKKTVAGKKGVKDMKH